jgi:aromatic-L-amino-acid/L-tryptophan decarboxylase
VVRGEGDANDRLLAAVNATGRMYLVHTKLSGATVLRLAVGSALTTEAHVDAAWREIRAAADAIVPPPPTPPTTD